MTCGPGVLFELCEGATAADVRHISAHRAALAAAVREAGSLAPLWLAECCCRALLWCVLFELLASDTLGLGAASFASEETAIDAAAVLPLSAAEPDKRRGGTARATAL